MSQWRVLSAVDQVAARLRTELLQGRWSGTMPGQDRVAVELGISRKLAEAALRLLEHQGLLEGQGSRRKRRIVLPADAQAVHPLRIAVLDYQRGPDQEEGYMVDLMHSLAKAGHQAFFLSKSLLDLGMDVSRVARHVGKIEADAWVVGAGSREILNWFSNYPTPSFALFGRYDGLTLAAAKPDKAPAFAAATRRLIHLGHQHIVFLCRRVRRLPEPGRSERAFLNELAVHGIPTSAYNLPDWEDDMAGFHERLNSLFRLTPPTALIIDEAFLFVAAQVFLAKRGLRVPEDVSVVCTDYDAAFAWCDPSIAHVRWESRALVRRIVRWAANVGNGHVDLRQIFTPAEFVSGGSIGPLTT